MEQASKSTRPPKKSDLKSIPYGDLRPGLYYSLNEVAAAVDKHPRTVRNWFIKGKIKAIKNGKNWRVRGQDLLDWLDYGEAGKPE